MEVKCFFCHRDLSKAQYVNRVAEGPICSICLKQNNEYDRKNENDQYPEYDQVLLG